MKYQGISDHLLETIVGGAGMTWDEIKAKVQPHCPKTVAKYGDTDPAKVTRPLAEQMKDACLAEMGPFKATFARGKLEKGINEAFPNK